MFNIISLQSMPAHASQSILMSVCLSVMFNVISVILKSTNLLRSSVIKANLYFCHSGKKMFMRNMLSDVYVILLKLNRMMSLPKDGFSLYFTPLRSPDPWQRIGPLKWLVSVYLESVALLHPTVTVISHRVLFLKVI